MATLSSARARMRATRLSMFGGTLLASIAALGMAGCESASNLLSGDNSPQASLASPLAPVSATAQSAKLQIAPVIGSPENVARDLQAQLASAVGRRGVTVTTAANAASEYVIRGYVVAAREKTKAKISYIWDVTDQSGKRVNRITGEEIALGAGKDPWGAVTPQVVGTISEKTAKQIASWLPGAASVPIAANTAPVAASPTRIASSTPAAAPTAPAASSYTTAANTAGPASQPSSPTTGSIASSESVTAVVPMVTGAPGDGGSALTSAIQRELTKNGLALANNPAPQSYKVQGTVAVGQGKAGKQPIQIDWSVLDPEGRKLGTVSQKNEVPEGSLDGAWGKTADAAAAAAAQGIIKLLPKSTN